MTAHFFACGHRLLLSILQSMTKSILIWLAAIAVTSPSASPAATPEPLTLKPSSKWQVNYADDKCRLVRLFGEGDQAVILFMDRYGPSESFRLTIAGKPFRTSVEKGEAQIQFGPREQEQQLSFLNGNLGVKPAFVFVGSERIAPLSDVELAQSKILPEDAQTPIQSISAERAKAVTFLRIGKPLRTAVILETGPLQAPFAALDKCIDDLLTTWGVDVERHKTLSQPAKPLLSPGQWITSSDYPLQMLDTGQPGLVNFRLSIGADGIPTACDIQATTRNKAFDDAVCKSVMRRARFSPALDAQGQPIATYYQNAVRFQLP